MDPGEIAEKGMIIRSLVGSTIHGLELAGTDDRDEMGVCMEPPAYVIGLNHFETWVHRTKPEGVRSEAGDLDLVVHSLRKYARLALKGNPTVLLLLFVKPKDLLLRTPLGDDLQALAPAFASRRAGHAFLGYLTAQKQRLLGERGQRNVKRPECREVARRLERLDFFNRNGLALDPGVDFPEPWVAVGWASLRDWNRDRDGKHGGQAGQPVKLIAARFGRPSTAGEAHR